MIKTLLGIRDAVNEAHYFMNNCMIQSLSAWVNYTLNKWFDYKDNGLDINMWFMEVNFFVS